MTKRLTDMTKLERIAALEDRVAVLEEIVSDLIAALPYDGGDNEVEHG